MSIERWPVSPESLPQYVIEKLRRYLGFRSSMSLLGLMSGDDKYPKQGFHTSRDRVAAKNITIPITGNETDNSPELTQLQAELTTFSQLAAWHFQQQLLDLIRKTLQQQETASPQMMNMMQAILDNPSRALPKFEIHVGSSRYAKITTIAPHLVKHFDTEGALLVFNLPDILDRYWREPLWFKMYSTVIKTVWRESRAAEYVQDLVFNRLNPEGDHPPGVYYYIFEIVQL